MGDFGLDISMDNNGLGLTTAYRHVRIQSIMSAKGKTVQSKVIKGEGNQR